jgi:hypothetical protein
MSRGFWLWCIKCVGSTSKCYTAARFLFALHVEFNVCIYVYRPVHVFDNISLGLLLDKFTSCYCGRGWSCAVVFYSVVFWVGVYFLLVCCTFRRMFNAKFDYFL